MLDLFGTARRQLETRLSEARHEADRLREENRALETELQQTKETMAQALAQRQHDLKNAARHKKEAEHYQTLTRHFESHEQDCLETLPDHREAILSDVDTLGQTLENIPVEGESEADVQSFIDSFSDNLDDIQSFIKVIKEIADQTNLLAVNATIESAKAGEHGRGFSIVAEEIGKLSGKTENVLDELGVQLKMIRSEFHNHIDMIKQREGECTNLNRLHTNVRALESTVTEVFDNLEQRLTDSKQHPDNIGD